MYPIVKNNLKSLGVFKDFSDGSIKTVLEKENSGVIELTLLFNKPNYDVICAPTHHFCNLGCKMCHLTNKGLNKMMIPIKVDDMKEAIVKAACFNLDEKLLDGDYIDVQSFKRRTDKDKLLISFMGVGEPTLNLDLLEQLYLQEEYLKDVLGYSEINYAISTMMPNKNVRNLTQLVVEHQIPLKLHFSLHSPYDESRFELIPSAKTTIDEALAYLSEYRDAVKFKSNIMKKYRPFHNSDDPVEIHYTLIKDVNDSKECLDEVVRLLKKWRVPIKFIRFNPINTLESSDKEDLWIETITAQIPGLRIKTYSPPGREIGSSCGEFTKHYYHEEIETPEQLKEFERWENKHKIYENNRNDYISWDEYYMGVAILSEQRSKDPSTQVGACIVSKDNRILSMGYNGTPNGINDECFNWSRNGDILSNKYAYVIHAEVNAILNYKGNMRDMNGAILYVTLFPCNECAKFIVQSGIKKIVYLSDKYRDKKETIAAKRLFSNCGISLVQYKSPRENITISF